MINTQYSKTYRHITIKNTDRKLFAQIGNLYLPILQNCLKLHSIAITNSKF